MRRFISTLKPKIIVIEDDLPIRRFLRTALETHGFEVYEAASGKQAISEANIRKADLIILDLGLPYTEGVEVVRAVRTWSEIPIIVLWAHGAEADKIEAFNAGANDSLTKPFGLSKLLDRIHVALSHALIPHAPTETGVFVTGNLRVDLLNRRVYNGDQEIRLTPVQYRLLAVLIKQGRQGRDAPADFKRSLGAELLRKPALSAHVHEPAQTQDRRRSSAAEIPFDRVRCRLPAEN